MNNTSRYAAAVARALIPVLLVLSPASAHALVISPSAPEVTVGETFELRFSDDLTGFFGAFIDATLSPASGVELVGLAPGAGLPAGATVDSALPALVTTPAAVSGTGLEFLVIRYRAKLPGQLLWNFEGAWDQELAPGVYETHDFVPAGVAVRVTAQTVPEASILALFALGLPLLGRFIHTARAGAI